MSGANTPGPIFVEPVNSRENHYSFKSDYFNREGEWRDIYLDLSGFVGSYNPHMFAAAPDLLEALLEAADFIQPFNRAEELLARIDAALAKARGAAS